jgi:pectate lyase
MLVLGLLVHCGTSSPGEAADAGAGADSAAPDDAGTADRSFSDVTPDAAPQLASGESGGASDAGPRLDAAAADAGGSVDSSAGVDAARPTDGGAEAASGDATTLDAPNVFATGSGQVEVFVNGVSYGKSSAARAILAVAAAIVSGENEIVVRASSGGAANPFAQLQVGGVFGKAGTSNRWKGKAAVGTEATDPTGPWAMLAFDDSTWANASDVNVVPAAPFPVDGPAHGIWTAAGTDATVLLRLKLYVPANFVASTPTGFGAGVVGGQGGPTVVVTTITEFVQAVAGNTARVVEFSGLLDFTGTEGPVTVSSCFQSQCADGTFEYITNDLGACTSAAKPTFNVTFDLAGKTAVTVGSNKTILGVGPNATIRGKGLRMNNGVSNVIVRNVTITDINPQIVWGGDAINIDNASRIWIDHVRVSLVGRQFFVTGFGPAANVTLSWNEFDGRTQWSATCNGAHYWTMLIAGSNDTITVANNWIHDTSGRGPHAGGLATTFDWMQFANDFYESVPGHAADPSQGSTLLYEGTAFNQTTTPIVVEATMAGSIYAPLASSVASTNAACQAALGRPCVANAATPQNGTFPLDQAVLMQFSTRRAGLVAPYPAIEVENAVPHLAGPGHI